MNHKPSNLFALRNLNIQFDLLIITKITGRKTYSNRRVGSFEGSVIII